MEESRKEVLKLYRQIMLWIPNQQVDWEIFDVPIDQMKENVAAEFRKNAHITNHRVVDKLRIKAGQVKTTFEINLLSFM